MEKIVYILKIICYFIFVFIMYQSAKRYRYKQLKSNANHKYRDIERISIICIFILAIIMGGYSLICGQIPYGGDRGNYATRFSSDIHKEFVKNNSLGLYYLQEFLHIFSYKPELLFFVVPFLYLFITLVAYRMCEDVEPLAILLMGLSLYCLFGFYMFKQCMAIAFIAVSFVAFTKKKKLLFIGSIFLALCFHESSWIVIPLYIASIGSKNKFIRIVEYILIIVCVIFFSQINQILIQLTSFIPGMDKQISGYLDESGGMEGDLNVLTAFKGLPYYIITIVGFLKREQLKEKIKNYDTYMIFSVFASATTVLSSFMYWMWRFGAYCYFPIFVFASLIHRELEDNKEKVYFKYILVVIFFTLVLKQLSQYYFYYGGF